LLFRALAQLFDELRMQQDAEFSVRVSYLELYNEEIFDLLSATEDTTRLQLYEDSTKKGSVIIKVGQSSGIRDLLPYFLVHLVMKFQYSRWDLSGSVFLMLCSIPPSCLQIFFSL
jgi:hypothetical protein